MSTTNLEVTTTYTLVVSAADSWCVVTNPAGVKLEFVTTAADGTAPDEDIAGHVLPTYDGVTRQQFVAGAIFARLADRRVPGNTSIVVVDSGV